MYDVVQRSALTVRQIKALVTADPRSADLPLLALSIQLPHTLRPAPSADAATAQHRLPTAFRIHGATPDPP